MKRHLYLYISLLIGGSQSSLLVGHLPKIVLSSSGNRCGDLACVPPSPALLLLLGQLPMDALVLQCLSLPA